MAYVPIIAQIESLPPLPESVLQIEKLFAQGDPEIQELVKIIESDPPLTTDILAKANSPFYGFTRKIVSVLQATTLFGPTQIRSIVLAASIQRSFDINLEPYNISTSLFSQISAMQSDFLFQWYMGINIDLAKEIVPIAFLMEIGKILISKEIREEEKTEEFLEDLYTYQDIEYTENKFVHMTTAQINALIFEHLNLNEVFYEVMRYLDSDKEPPKELEEQVRALRVTQAAINVLDQLNENSIEKALELIEEYGYSKEHFLRVVTRITNKYLS
ncbi:MAG: HDOD domain-containing protein [Epsilonproteobacteria bacterium]|nr:HDOD domain-containing protein [Campylobacterota bacterium]